MTKLTQLLSVGVLVALGAVSKALASEKSDPDPYQELNRTFYRFNQSLDQVIARPLATAYTRVLPDPLEEGIGNVFANLDEMSNILNNLLQGKFSQAAKTSGRLLINTTMGLGGLFDVAQRAGLAKDEAEDFGQTLAVWGVAEGPYLMLPLVGPSTLRDAPAKFIDSFANPVAHWDDVAERNTIRVLSLVATRAELLDLDSMISGDGYLFVRDVYLQRREYLVNDGAIEDDFGDLEDY